MVSIEKQEAETKETGQVIQEPLLVEDDGDEWKQLMGNDILKKTIEPAEKEDGHVAVVAVQPQDAVVVDFVGRLAISKDDTEGPIFHEAKDWLIVIGEKDVVPVLELGVRFMNVGEQALVWGTSKFAYGPLVRKHGDYTLPPNSNVCYQVTVKSAVLDAEQNEVAFQIRYSRSKKAIGNDVYQNEWSEHSTQKPISLYKRGAQALELIAVNAEDEKIRTEAKQVMIDCLNNVVAVYLRAKECHKAKEAAVEVLKHDPNNITALIRAAKAALLDPASSYEEVQAAIQVAEENCPKEDETTLKEIATVREKLKRRKSTHKKKEKEMMTKMAQGMQGKTTKERPKKEESLPNHTSSTATAEEDLSEKTPDAVKDDKKINWRGFLLSYVFQMAVSLIIVYFAKRFRSESHADTESQSDEF